VCSSVFIQVYMSLQQVLQNGSRRWQSKSAQSAFSVMRSRAADAASRAGFVDRQVALPNGEPLSFLERPPVGGGRASSVVVFLHGMTNDRILSAASFAKVKPWVLIALFYPHPKLPFDPLDIMQAAETLPNARCLLPDAPGHGGRMPWAMQGTDFNPNLSAGEHVKDFEIVLQTLLDASPESLGITPPLDLIGYSMGWSAHAQTHYPLSFSLCFCLRIPPPLHPPFPPPSPSQLHLC